MPRHTVSMVLTLLLVGSSLPLLTYAQPSQGNWTISDTELVQNKSIVLNGNLTVKAGGNLTLSNVTLTINNQYNGQHGISVEQGGSMFIYSSKIAPSDPKNRFTFVVRGSNFVMKNSEVHGVGWCSPEDYSTLDSIVCVPNRLLRLHAGLVVETDNAIIEDDVISGNSIGMIVMGSYATVKGNLFSSNDLFTLAVYGSSYDSILNNTFRQDPTVYYESMVFFYSHAQNITFSHNTVTENISFLEASIRANTGKGRMDGITIFDSVGTVVADNNVSVSNIAVYPDRSHNSVIVNNKLTFAEAGIVLRVGVNSKVERNTLQVNPYGASYGIWANFAHNSVIANNSISGRPNHGIYLDHTSNSSVLNNNVSLTRSSLAAVTFLVSKNNSVIGNTISGARFGMVLSGSSDRNLITRNSVLADHSVTMEGASSNQVYLNNLHDFREPFGGPYDNGKNTWYRGSGGNYWSYYTGQDQQGNGIGDEPYSRTIVPPNGTEPYSERLPVQIITAAVPQMRPIPLPSSGPYVDIHVIKNEVIEIDSGTLPGNLTIINSTLLLGRKGTVYMATDSGSLTIKNSRFIDMGYGSWLGRKGSGPVGPASLIIENSTLDGAYLNDLNVGNLTIKDSTIMNSPGDRAVSEANATSVVIVNNTFSGAVFGVGTYCDPGISNRLLVSGNKFYNVVETSIYVCVSKTRAITIADNVIVGNLGNGIQVRGNAVVRGNMISGVKGCPLQLYNDNNTAFGNTVSDSSCRGLDIIGNGNVVYQNNFINNPNPVLVIGSGNLIYHNNFINFSNQPNDQTGRNSWSYKGEGNYWSSYKGADSDLDGIGDSPYVIGNGAQDNYPYMTKNGWLLLPNSFKTTVGSYTSTVVIRSNSTITNFTFNPDTRALGFAVAGAAGTRGAANVVFPMKLLSGTFTAEVNGSSVPFTSQQNATHVLISFSYAQSPRLATVTILGTSAIPEFPLETLPFVLVASLGILLLAFRLVKRNPKPSFSLV